MDFRKLVSGRALYAESDRVWVAQGMLFFAVDFSGKRVTPLYSVGTIKDKIVSCHRISRQLLRRGIHHLLPLPSGDILVSTKRKAFVIAADGSCLAEFATFCGNKPAPYGICCTPDGTVFFAEYSQNFRRENDTVLYRSLDGGRHFCPILTLKKTQIRHIHFVQYDPYDKYVWLGTGDEDRECMLMCSMDDGNTWETVGSGSQNWRAIGITFQKDSLIWGTDAGHVPNQNHIVRMDRRSQNLEFLSELDGPVHGCGYLKDGRVFLSTGVEGGENEKDRYARLFAIEGNCEHIIRQKKKDMLPLVLQYGVMRICPGNECIDKLIFTEYALSGGGETVFIEK